MTKLSSPFLNELTQRGFIYQYSNLVELDKYLVNNKIKAYIGFDCTADSLHIGSLTQLMIFRLLQKHGHTPVVLLGGGTSLIGDPSGKDNSRPILTNELIELNKQGIKKVISKFLDKKNTIFIDNAEWLTKINYINFLREYGKLFTVNRMLTFESVKLRLEREQPLTFLEFNYMLLQAIDYLYLYKHHNVMLQLGGSDQWGNIINGVDLIRKITNKEVFALTSPLITNSDGSKMGKTAKGAIWLSKDKISSWEYYQYWRNIEDSLVIRFLKLFTELPLQEISQLEALKGKELNEAKKILAFETTKICFGEIEAHKNATAAVDFFEKGIISNNLPTVYLTFDELNTYSSIIELISYLKITNSKNEARKLINNNGLKINDILVDNHKYIVNKDMFNNNQLKISIGKKKHILIQLT